MTPLSGFGEGQPMTFAGVNYLAILVAAVAGWLFGAVWYMALVKAVDRRAGLAAEFKDDRPRPARAPPPQLPFILAFVAELVMAWVLAGLLGHLGAGRGHGLERHRLRRFRLARLRRHHYRGEQHLSGPMRRADA